jgi:hypothetical protein
MAINISFCLHGNLRLKAMSIFSSPHGGNQFFLCLAAIILPRGLASRCIFVRLLGHHHLLLASRAPSSSFGIASTFIFCWHLECYHLLLALQVPSSSFSIRNTITAYFFIGFTIASLREVVSSILPHCAPLWKILSSIWPLWRYYLKISIQPHGCTSPGNILLLIAHQGFLRAALPWRPFLPDSSRLPFIGVGVAFLAMPCNEQPFASFLMLSLKASVHWCWCCFPYDTG